MKTQSIRIMLDRLETLGLSSSDALSLRRIAMTLTNWSEKECGVNAGHIERDEETNIPYWYPTGWYSSTAHKYIKPEPCRINDLEAGALRRLSTLASRYPDLIFYNQTDPRGASVYVLRKSDVPDGSLVEQVYSRGLAVWKGY